LFTASDADGDPITEYEFWESAGAAGSGHFFLNGVQQSASTIIDVPASQLGQFSFVTGTVSNNLQVRAYDGVSWSAGDTAPWAPFTVSVPAPLPPVVTTSNIGSTARQTLAASS